MADQRQVNSIIATAICDARKEDPDHRMDPEEAKQIAKCIVEALTDAGPDRTHPQGVIEACGIALGADLTLSDRISLEHGRQRDIQGFAYLE